MATDNEIVEYDIKLMAQGALVQLAELTTSTASFNNKMKEAILAVESFAARTGMSFEKVKSVFKSLDEQFAEGKGKSVVFGGAGSSSWDKITTSVQRTNKAMQDEQVIVEKTGAALSRKLQAQQRIYDQAQLEKANQAAMKQLSVEEKILEARQKKLDLANKEQAAVDQEGAAIQKQLSMYGQISRTAAEATNYLKSFAGTEQGQGILTKFFGNYQAAQNVTGQVNSIKSAIVELSKATGTSFQQAGQLIKQQFSQIPGVTNQVNQAVRQMGKEFEQAEKKSTGSINAIRIALGILVSMLIHTVIQAIQQMVTQAITNLRELEAGVYNILNAERTLSEAGIDITPKGLDETIKKLQQLDPLLSKIQATEVVSSIATRVAPAVGFNAKEIEQLSQDIAILAIRNKALGKSFEEVEKQVTDAFLTGRVSVGINNLGVKINDQIVKDEALRMGLVETGDEFDNLTGKMEANVKARAMLSILTQNANKDLDRLPEYFQTADAALGVAQARFQDLLTTIGVNFGPLIIEIFGNIAKRLEDINNWLIANEGRIKNFVALLTGVSSAVMELSNIQGQGLFEKSTHPLENARRLMDAFKEGVKNAQKYTTDFANAADTATASVDGMGDAVQQFDASSMIDQIQDVLDKAREAQENLDIQMGRKTVDLDIEYDRKAEDALIDYQRKVEDINRETEDKVQDIKDKRREEDKKREEEYQNKLWELQQKYLMDLEDALHERDARQIIRLQRQYEFEKQKLERQKELEDSQSQRKEKQDIKEVKNDQKDKLEEAAIDYQRKLTDLNNAKAREQADLQTWYDREQQDLQLAQQRQLQTLIEGWVTKQQVTQENAQALYGILLTYFGPGGLTDSIFAYLASSLNQFGGMQAAGLNMAGLGQPIPGMTTPGTPSGGNGGTYVGQGVYIPSGLAEGGAFLATTPTSLNVGESGPELIQATPIGRTGQDVNKLFMGANPGAGSAGGAMEIGVTLSPDLEARVIRKTLDETASVILKVNRTKI